MTAFDKWFDELQRDVAGDLKVPVDFLRGQFDRFINHVKFVGIAFQMHAGDPARQERLARRAVAAGYAGMLALFGVERSIAELEQDSKIVRLIADEVVAKLRAGRAKA